MHWLLLLLLALPAAAAAPSGLEIVRAQIEGTPARSLEIVATGAGGSSDESAFPHESHARFQETKVVIQFDGVLCRTGGRKEGAGQKPCQE